MLRPFAAADAALSGDPIVHIVVVNRITLTVPVEEVVADIERELPAIFAGLDGFVGQTLVKTGPQELVVVGRWTSPEAAANGAAVIGPGAFNTWVAPRASAHVDQFPDALPARVEPASRAIGSTAAALRAEHGAALRLPDALVVATAVALGADRILTTDAGWPKLTVAVEVLSGGR